jgi:AcrR family transcriptional regulator
VSEFAFAAGGATPRKRPVQGRSQETVAAILEATVRVLDEDGDELTTTRVAEVAGVGVGTLYQYFPNREALIHGVLAEHLEAAIGALERATGELAADTPLDAAAAHVVRAFLSVKAERAATSRTLNRVFGPGQLDDRPMVKAAAARRDAVAIVLSRGAVPDEPTLARAGVACAAMEGVVRAAILEDPERLRDPAWVDRVVALAVAAVGSA